MHFARLYRHIQEIKMQIFHRPTEGPRLEDPTIPEEVEDPSLASGVPTLHKSPPSSTLPILISLVSLTISIPPQSPFPSSFSISSSASSSSTSIVVPGSARTFFLRSRRACAAACSFARARAAVFSATTSAGSKEKTSIDVWPERLDITTALSSLKPTRQTESAAVVMSRMYTPVRRSQIWMLTRSNDWV